MKTNIHQAVTFKKKKEEEQQQRQKKKAKKNFKTIDIAVCPRSLSAVILF